MSNPNYSDASRVIANVFMGIGALIGTFVYDLGWPGYLVGAATLAFAAYQFFVVDAADGYRDYGPKRDSVAARGRRPHGAAKPTNKELPDE